MGRSRRYHWHAVLKLLLLLLLQLLLVLLLLLKSLLDLLLLQPLRHAELGQAGLALWTLRVPGIDPEL